MPRTRPLYLQRHVTRHGRVAWYVRVGRGKLVRIHGEYGTEDFNEQYRAALAGKPLVRTAPGAGTLQWLYERYQETTAWSDLSEATRRQRQNILKGVMDKSGNENCSAISQEDIEAGKDDRRNTPAQARNFLDAMRGLFRWAKKAKHVTVDPTDGVNNPLRAYDGPGFHAWSLDDLAAYYAKWPVGTRQRVWIDVLLYTGLRRGDAVVVGRQHIKDGLITLKTEKTGTEVYIPVRPQLAATLQAGPTADLAFICGAAGKPLTKETFGNLFKAACIDAGLEDRSAHGVRKLSATIVADNEGTEAELEALYGWHGGQMASRYTRSANRKRLAQTAARKLMLAPDDEVRAAGEIKK